MPCFIHIGELITLFSLVSGTYGEFYGLFWCKQGCRARECEFVLTVVMLTAVIDGRVHISECAPGLHYVYLEWLLFIYLRLFSMICPNAVDTSQALTPRPRSDPCTVFTVVCEWNLNFLDEDILICKYVLSPDSLLSLVGTSRGAIVR